MIQLIRHNTDKHVNAELPFTHEAQWHETWRNLFYFHRRIKRLQKDVDQDANFERKGEALTTEQCTVM